MPRQSISACRVAVRCSVTITGNGTGGSGRSRSAASIARAVVDPASLSRRRPSCRAAKAVRLACACSSVTSSASVRQKRCAAVWLFFSTTPFRFPERGRQAIACTPWCFANAANWLVRSPLAGSSTVRIRSKRQSRVSPPSSASTVVIAASRCGRSIEGDSTARQTPECASEPTSA